MSMSMSWWQQSLRALALMPMLVLVACASGGGTGDGEIKPAEKKGAAVVEAEIDQDHRRDQAVATRVQAGVEALKARDPERARRHISRAIELDPGSAEAHNAMALLYRYEGDEKREEDHYRKALRANGKFSQARNNYAALLYRQGRYRDAIDQLERAADDTSYDQRSLAFLNLGRSYVKVGQLEKAEYALQRALRLDSSQADATLELADVLLALKKYADARAYFATYVARARHTARSLWIGIRIESALNEPDKVASYEFQLEKMFKGTPEYAAWQAWKSGPAPAATDKRKAR